MKNKRVAGPKRFNTKLAGLIRPQREPFGPEMAQATSHERKKGKCRSNKIPGPGITSYCPHNTSPGCLRTTVGKEENRDKDKVDFFKNHNRGHQISGKLITTTKQNETNSKTTQAAQTEMQTTTIATQNTSNRKEDTEENCRVDPNICIQEEHTHNVEPPTMRTTSQLEASHYIITGGLFATLEKATNTAESEEDTPLFRQRLQRVLGVRFVAAGTKKGQNLRPLINFDWEPLKFPTDNTGTTYETGYMSERTVYL